MSLLRVTLSPRGPRVSRHSDILSEDDHIKIMGIRVIEASTLPEGILMFVRDGQSIGMIDNRKDRKA